MGNKPPSLSTVLRILIGYVWCNLFYRPMGWLVKQCESFWFTITLSRLTSSRRQINSYVSGPPSDSPLLVIGTAGAGKSALTAKCTADAVQMAKNGRLAVPKWARVFFSFSKKISFFSNSSFAPEEDLGFFSTLHSALFFLFFLKSQIVNCRRLFGNFECDYGI